MKFVQCWLVVVSAVCLCLILLIVDQKWENERLRIETRANAATVQGAVERLQDSVEVASEFLSWAQRMGMTFDGDTIRVTKSIAIVGDVPGGAVIYIENKAWWKNNLQPLIDADSSGVDPLQLQETLRKLYERTIAWSYRDMGVRK